MVAGIAFGCSRRDDVELHGGVQLLVDLLPGHVLVHRRRGRVVRVGEDVDRAAHRIARRGTRDVRCVCCPVIRRNITVFGETLAGIAEVNFQLKVPLQKWITVLNLPFTAIALIILALALYLLTPENYLTIRQALPGAIFFSLGWITLTKLFQIYVARYDRYNPTYLALASLIVLLTWMYLTCLLLLLGGKLNAILRRERKRAAQISEAVPQPA